MRDRDYNYGVVFESIEQRVRKVSKDAPSDTRLDFRRSERVSADESHRAIKFVEKLNTFTGASLLEPEVSFIDLLLSECEEPDFHLA